MEPNFKVALEHFAAKEAQDYFLEEVPILPWSKIGGQEEAIGVIKDAIELPLLHPELVRPLRQAPAQGHSAVRPSRLRQDPDRQGDRLQSDAGVPRAHGQRCQRILHVHQRPRKS